MQPLKHLKTLGALFSLLSLFSCDSSTSPAKSVNVPNAPVSVTGLAGNAQVAVYWFWYPTSSGDSVTGYTATAMQDNSKHCTSVSVFNCVVTGLTNGTP